MSLTLCPGPVWKLPSKLQIEQLMLGVMNSVADSPRSVCDSCISEIERHLLNFLLCL